MSIRRLSSELIHEVGRAVRVRGWFHTLRSLGKVHFLILRDRKGLIQVVIEDPLEYQKLKGLQAGSVLTVSATVISTDGQASVPVELIHPYVEVESAVNDVPPIEYTKLDIPYELEFILDHRALSLRNRKIQAVFLIQAEIAQAYRHYMYHAIDAVEYFSPNLIGTSSEGGAEFFSVDYFGHTATLAQSSQLYKQVMVGVNERVFALMPFFRAEKSHTTRHLSEGKQFEFEMGFFDDWHELMDIQEGVIKAILNHLSQKCANEIELLGGDIVKAPFDVAFPRWTFKEAQQIYFEQTGIDDREEDDLSPAAEKILCQYALETVGTELVFITDWKTSKRPFYSYPSPNDPTVTHTFDLLCAGTEITSGGQRRHTYASMLEGIIAKEMDPKHFEDYLSIFKYGMPMHGGFGMGLERLTMTLLKLKNIREASLFPSDPKRIAGNRLKARVFYGAENIRNEWIRLLKAQDIVFSLIDPTDRVEHALPMKAMILKGKKSKQNYLVLIKASDKIDMKRISDKMGERCEFESKEVIEQRYGLTVTETPIVGQLMNLPVWLEESAVHAPQWVFSSGIEGERMCMYTNDVLPLLDPIIF